MKTQWTIQAFVPGRGWVAICDTNHRTNAEQIAQRLRLDDSAWSHWTQPRRVRIVRLTETLAAESVA